MFFSFTNSLAIFQTMINNILRDLIDIEDIVVFIDNVLVGTKNKKKHDKIVEEILRKMEVNDLYLKPEKCVWKVKEIDFLELAIETNGIKIQKEKMSEVLEQSRYVINTYFNSSNAFFCSPSQFYFSSFLTNLCSGFVILAKSFTNCLQ